MEDFLKNIKDIFSYTFTSITTIVFFLVLLFLFQFDFWAALVISLAAGAYLFYKTERTKPVERVKRLRKISSEKEQFYKSKGLTKEEINYFRETMQSAKLNILKLENSLNASTKLKTIEKRNNTIHLAKMLFKDIAMHPNRLHEVNKFLYVHLPSLTELTQKYLEVDHHEVKQKATYDILNESAETIDSMCNQIAKDYVAFKSDEVDDMELEVELAKKLMTQSDETSDEIQREEL